MPGVARLQPRGSVAAAAAVLPPRRGWKPLYHRRGRKPLRGAVARAQAAVEIGTTFATRCGLTADACQPARMRQLREKHGSCAARAESAPAMLLGTVEEEAAAGGRATCEGGVGRPGAARQPLWRPADHDLGAASPLRKLAMVVAVIQAMGAARARRGRRERPLGGAARGRLAPALEFSFCAWASPPPAVGSRHSLRGRSRRHAAARAVRRPG
jgi:hypothetical protein